MAKQVQGEVFIGGCVGTAGVTRADWAHMPWFSAQAEFGTSSAEVISNAGIAVRVEVRTRAAEGNGTVANVLTVGAITTVGVQTKQITSAAKQQVRYRFKTSVSASVSQFVVMRALQPVWNQDRVVVAFVGVIS